jgi:hypothetical protein
VDIRRYYILPAQLRDQVPAFREALYMFTSAMRRLDGQVYSFNRAKELNILPGSRAIDKRELNEIHSDLVKGLCLFEGCLPISHLNPGLHHFVHYAQYTRLIGLMRWYWMLCFERYVHSSAFVYSPIHIIHNISTMCM